MRRILNKAKNHREAEKWDIQQQVTMSPEERKQVALELKRRYYGSRVPDVRGKRK
jgi:HEPN domain-containing protein